MDEIVDCLTKPKYAQKLIVILAGYDNDINRLMAQNPGLTSRFPEAIIFRGLQLTDCLELLVQLMRSRQFDMRKKEKDLDFSVLELPAPDFEQTTLNKFETLGNIANWANARDVQTIAKSIFGLLLKAGTTRKAIAFVTEDHVSSVLDSMIAERSQREVAAKVQPSSLQGNMTALLQAGQTSIPPRTVATCNFALNTSEAEKSQHSANKVQTAAPANQPIRDSGVSDAAWQQLQRDKEAAQKKEEQYKRLIKSNADVVENITILQQKEQASEQAFQQATKDDDQAIIQEAKRLREEARINHEVERRAQEELHTEIERQIKAQEEERRREAKAQQKLRTMGICPAGFRWIKQNGGYRCTGGSHFITESGLGL